LKVWNLSEGDSRSITNERANWNARPLRPPGWGADSTGSSEATEETYTGGNGKSGVPVAPLDDAGAETAVARVYAIRESDFIT